uniref:CipA n=1 Tax=Ganoderma boninense TaxID=34458 RepID=A0A5K1K713_9APHY|nr:CipA [Ganoderma boninense]
MSAAIVEQPFNASLDHLNRPISTAVMPIPTISSLHEDIVALVFAEFNTWLPAERAACARGALVCRTWAGPASKTLWRSLRSLLPLYGILLPVPQVVRKTYIGNFHGSHVPLSYIEYIGEILKTRPFDDPTVWSSFLRCASRIRQLIDWDPRFDLRILRALCHHNGGNTVLPVLRTLSWADAKSPRSDEALALFAPPTLQHLAYHINSETPAQFISNTLTNLVPKAPYLSSLKIVVDTRMTTRLPLLPFLWQFQRLRRLSFLGCQVVTPSCLTGFSSFPTLEHLECNIEGFEAYQVRYSFDVPNLLVLRITGTGTSMRGLLRTLRAPRIQDLVLDAREKGGEPACDAHRDLFRDMPTAPFACSLQKFSYHSGPAKYGPPHHQVHPNRTSFLELIHPLLSLKQLRRVSIICHWEEVGLGDEEVLAAAEAWRDVEELMLAPLERYQEPLAERSLRPTTLCLPHLHRLCPNLSFLALPIDMETPEVSVPSGIDGTEGQNLRPHRLKRFDILGYRSLMTSQEDLEALARYLAGAFPDLEPCAPFVISKDPWDSMWSKLRSLQESQRDLVGSK